VIASRGGNGENRLSYASMAGSRGAASPRTEIESANVYTATRPALHFPAPSAANERNPTGLPSFSSNRLSRSARTLATKVIALTT
jgi:hypothetical protein